MVESALFSKGSAIIRTDKLANWVNLTVSLVREPSGEPKYFVEVDQEIMGRKRAEELLRESEARYRSMFQSNPQPMWVFDLKTLAFLAVNDAAIAHYGYSHDEFLAMTIRDIRPPEDVPRLLANISRVREGIDQAGTWSHCIKDGSTILVEITSHQLDFDGRPAELVLAHDITARKRSEMLLRESEERLRDLMFSMADWVWEVDVNGVFTFSSQKGFEYFGNNLIGKTLFEFMPPDEAKRVIAIFSGIVENKAPIKELDHWYIQQNGEKINLLTNGVPVLDDTGNVKGFRGVDKDITERKRTEAAFRESEERHRTILQTAMDGFLMADAQGQILDVNETYCRMSGYSAQELLAMRISDLEVVDSADEIAARIRKIMKEGESRFESRHRRKDGSVFDIEISIQYRPAEGGWTTAFLRDITEQCRLAEEKARLEDQLRQAQKVEAIGRLAGGVAHDFNNMTAIVIGYGEMLLGQLLPEDPGRKWAEQIVAAGRRSAALTRQLLAFSRRQVLLPVVLDLNGLLWNLEKMLGRLIGEDIALTLDLAEGLGRITADPGQTEQVVTNLVINARDAMPRGGRLTVLTTNVELDKSFAGDHESVVPGEYVKLTLTDTGCGMDKATLARLFEPFFTTKEKGKGTGLGLATAFGIVKQSGGYFYVSSEPDKGTTFTIYLPRTYAKVKEETIEASDEVPSGRGELILLVEDEAALREFCETLLSQLGYQVIAAGSGQEALALVQKKRLEPDLVVTDVIMPGMSGAEMAEQFRRDWPGLKVLYMSGYPDEALAPHGVISPGMPFLHKPFTERALAVKVREALGGKPATTRLGRSVLMIDDDEQFIDLVGHFCRKRGNVFVGVSDSAAAIAILAGQLIDVLLVDMNIPGTDGEHVLREIRVAGHAAPAIVLTGDVASADMDLLRPLGVVLALEKSGNAEPLLQAIEAVGTAGDRWCKVGVDASGNCFSASPQ